MATTVIVSPVDETPQTVVVDAPKAGTEVVVSPVGLQGPQGPQGPVAPPAGTNKQVQFNDNGVIAGSTMTWDKTTNTLALTGASVGMRFDVGGTTPVLELFPAAPGLYKIERSGTTLLHSTQGGHQFNYNGSAVFGTIGNQMMLWGSLRAVNDTLEQRNGTNPQTFRIYSGYTDASNNRHAKLEWSADKFNINADVRSGTYTTPATLALNGYGTEFWSNGAKRLDIGSNGSVNISAPGVTNQTALNITNMGEGSAGFRFAWASGGWIELGNTGGKAALVVTNKGGLNLAAAGQGNAQGAVVLGADANAMNLGNPNGIFVGANATWDTVTTTYTGFKLNITDTASAAGSKLMDLQVDSTSKFSVKKDGTLRMSGGAFGNVTMGVGDSDGFYFSSNEWALQSSNAGHTLMAWGQSAGIRVKSDVSLGWTSSGGANSTAADVRLWREGPGTLALRNGANAQEFRLYQNYVDASNYSYLPIRYESAASRWVIVPTNGGSGVQANLYFGSMAGSYVYLASNITYGGSLFAAGDGTSDIGQPSANRPRHLYMTGSVNVPMLILGQNAVLQADAANILALKNGANAQAFRAYNTTDGTNSEWLMAGFSGSVAYLQTEKSGSGTQRGLRINSASTLFQIAGTGVMAVTPSGVSFSTDNIFDVGGPSAGRPATVYVGTKVATPQVAFPAVQVSSTDPNTLDDYAEGTFTPTITFGGASVGVTYTVRNGTYTKVGNTVNFKLYALLSNKGSSTGNLAVSGLPFNSSGNAETYCAVAVHVNGMTGVSGGPQGFVQVSSASIALRQSGTGTASNLSDANCTNTTEVMVSGTYFV